MDGGWNIPIEAAGEIFGSSSAPIQRRNVARARPATTCAGATHGQRCDDQVGEAQVEGADHRGRPLRAFSFGPPDSALICLRGSAALIGLEPAPALSKLWLIASLRRRAASGTLP